MNQRLGRVLCGRPGKHMQLDEKGEMIFVYRPTRDAGAVR